jgi:YbbR domain-containing protein
MIPWLRHIIFGDFWLKLFSLAMAVLIWLTVNFAIQRQVSPMSPINLIMTERVIPNLPVVILSSAAEDVRGLRVNPKEVEVTVRGEAKAVDNLHSTDIKVIVDLTGIEAAHDLRKKIQITTPAGVTYVKVEPDEVQVVYPPRN